MKILHVVPAIRNGGVASVLFNLAKSQKQNGNDVTIYVSRPQLRDKEQEFRQYGINVMASRYNNRHNPCHILELKKLLPQYDLVHVHLFPDQLFVSIAFKLLSKAKRPILITTEHSTYNNRRKIKIFRYFDRWFYNSYDAIVNISPASKLNLDKWFGKKSLINKSITITNGIDISKYRDADNIIRDEIGLSTNEKIVVMVSRLIYPKDPITLLKAVSKCDNNVHVVFIGYGPLEKDLNELAANLNISYRVHLLGRKDSAAPYLRGCDIGVLSTLWDGFGLVAVEYMAAGIPVLASDVDGLRDVVGRNENLFNVGDYGTLASKITDLLNNTEKYRKEKNIFSKRALKFSSEKMNHEYLQLYSQLQNKK